MKAYSIGREVGCDIVIHDSTDVISRRHAILNVMPSGKMTIVDQSHNGTYVNGIRISPNVPVPVTRKDNISFAHVARLDWNMVPKTKTPMQYALIGIIAIAVVAGVFAAFFYLGGNSAKPKSAGQQVADSTLIKKQQEEKAKEDSVNNAKKKQQEQQAQPAKTKKEQPKQPAKEKVCPTCKKKISACEYQGKHPKQEKKCPTCGKTLKECEYQGKHPAKTTSRGDH